MFKSLELTELKIASSEGLLPGSQTLCALMDS